jgi:hypothetical protein
LLRARIDAADGATELVTTGSAAKYTAENVAELTAGAGTGCENYERCRRAPTYCLNFRH